MTLNLLKAHLYASVLTSVVNRAWIVQNTLSLWPHFTVKIDVDLFGRDAFHNQ